MVSSEQAVQSRDLVTDVKVSSATPPQDVSVTSSEAALATQTFAKLGQPVSPIQVNPLNTSFSNDVFGDLKKGKETHIVSFG